MMPSTLVETVSLNYEDFNDSFLTCGTCLCMYDGVEHHPKLLPCSHTVCRGCLERIIAAQTLDTGSFRCPICREVITLPQGGVVAFPASFLVNQLLDLMASQRRDIIPKCSVHSNQELLFCETCDIVFCVLCTDGNHNDRGASEHTVIPFAIAIKRMSEILLYKAHLCIKNLNNAYENVSEELRRLEHSVDRTLDQINRSFQDVVMVIDKRRHECLQWVRKIREEKKTILKEQLDLIQAEKERVQQECDGLQYQVEVRNITKKIGDLNEKLDTTSTLAEPRENSFIRYEYKHNEALKEIARAVGKYGQIKVSTTFPALSTAKIGEATSHLRSSARVSTVDYHGNPRSSGSDPVTAELRTDAGEMVETKIKDNDDGTYDIIFVPPKSGDMKLCISIFCRPIKGSPFRVQVTDHINSVWKFGSRGTGILNLVQPVRVSADTGGCVYILDTGNSRIVVLGPGGEVIRHIGPAGLEQQSATGLCTTPDGNLAVINWRTKFVSIMTTEGDLVKKFTTQDFIEPIDIAVNSRGDIIVADSSAGKVFIFDPSGILMTTFGSKGEKDGQFKLISALTVGKCDEILVTDHRVQIFSRDGKFSRRLPDTGKGQYGGITVDAGGHILATKMEKGKGFVQVMNSSGKLLFCIDSYDSKLKRPSGLVAALDFHIVVVDLGNDCIKKFRYK
ncbi:tripartite motif-containing protein 2-like [Gigantopelta aegis]|uniref:tripartite motif-containing protein 2-like n=1 Tax=Gigantopelta aegis TaxID=1735272 RepID=UPI001B88E240|nr:tripartite motif-containing protein 2-like [Gigantopelta aegis]XP_041377657.1 tripartite motif-containing protein 2-like [Gigantopelta aegis]